MSLYMPCCLNWVYKRQIISTIVDHLIPVASILGVYKRQIISTIVDDGNIQVLNVVYKRQIISTIVDERTPIIY